MAHELEDAEVIRQQMHETRSALADKLESLEQHVIGTVQDTTAAVADTAEKVSEVVEGTVDTVKDTVESVRQTFDVGLQVDRHPWIMMGGSVALGYCMGRLLTNGNGNGSAPAPAAVSDNGFHAPPPPPPKPSYLGELLAPELEKVKALAFGAMLGLVRDVISQSIPSTLEEPVRDVMDQITNKLGGQPVHGPVLADTPHRHAP